MEFNTTKERKEIFTNQRCSIWKQWTKNRGWIFRITLAIGLKFGHWNIRPTFLAKGSHDKCKNITQQILLISAKMYSQKSSIYNISRICLMKVKSLKKDLHMMALLLNLRSKFSRECNCHWSMQRIQNTCTT